MILFAVPTNRDVSLCLESIKKEMTWVTNKTGENTALLITDNSAGGISNNNKENLSRNDVKVYYADLNSIRKLINDLNFKIGLPKLEIEQLLLPDRVDHGKISNLIYLYTILLGERKFHRRDSDCTVEGLNTNEYPIVKEIEYIGRSPSEFSDLTILDNVKYGENDKISIVGSGYYGDWDLDIRDLKNPTETLNVFGGLANSTNEYQEMKIKGRYQNDIRETDTILKTRYKIARHILCGNMCQKDVFYYIPNFIGENAVAFDYFTYYYSFLNRVPICIHPNKINHRHDKTRKEKEKLERYWIGIIKMHVYKLLTQSLSIEFFKHINLVGEFNDLREWDHTNKYYFPNAGVDGLKTHSGKVISNMITNCTSKIDNTKISEIIDTICNDILSQQNNFDIKIINKKIRDNQNFIQEQVINDFHLSARLMEIWPDIVKYILSLNASSYYEEIN